jgi:hypothetical protein
MKVTGTRNSVRSRTPHFGFSPSRMLKPPRASSRPEPKIAIRGAGTPFDAA